MVSTTILERPWGGESTVIGQITKSRPSVDNFHAALFFFTIINKMIFLPRLTISVFLLYCGPCFPGFSWSSGQIALEIFCTQFQLARSRLFILCCLFEAISRLFSLLDQPWLWSSCCYVCMKIQIVDRVKLDRISLYKKQLNEGWNLNLSVFHFRYQSRYNLLISVLYHFLLKLSF